MNDGFTNGSGAGAPGWQQRVAVVPGPRGFAYAPGQVLTTATGPAIERLGRLFPDAHLDDDCLEVDDRSFTRVTGVPDVPLAVQHLRSFGLVAQPNHVVFAHCADACCGPHPALLAGCGAVGTPVHASPVYASPVYASPVYASPVYASPVYASPVYASPVYASPVYASPVYASAGAGPRSLVSAYVKTGRRRSSARSASADERTALEDRLQHVPGYPKDALPDVVVLDTGLAIGAHGPGLLKALGQKHLVVAGDHQVDVPDSTNGGSDVVDPAAGHGSFIAVLVERVAPGARVEVWRVLHPQGDGDEAAIAAVIERLPRRDGPGDRGAVLNLSFGGYVMDGPGLLAAAIRTAQTRGYVVVASAGNDGVCRPTYPAALPGVISVGAIGPGGPAPFSNYGHSVRACAPGVDLVSTFFTGVDGPQPETDGYDPDEFDGCALWSGTSFSAPIVAGALAHQALTRGVTVHQAVERVIDDPALLRIPGLGTVVNVI
jgi:hypothetical protein